MWFEKWFNEDYLNLYSHRTIKEAQQQVNFIVNVLGLKGGENILDLACGTGRHSIAFGLAGFKVTGIDLSKILIQKAKERLSKDSHLSVNFLVEDLFSLPQMGGFNVVINLFTSFGYFDDDQKNLEVFNVVHDHLLDKGQFFLDFLHPYQVNAHLIPEEKLIVNGECVNIRRWLTEDSVVKSIEFPGRTYEEKVKLYTRGQIEEMLGNANLSVVKAWNDYEGSSWRKEGDRQLFLCKKKGG